MNFVCWFFVSLGTEIESFVKPSLDVNMCKTDPEILLMDSGQLSSNIKKELQSLLWKHGNIFCLFLLQL